jgi:hypothetical protein
MHIWLLSPYHTGSHQAWAEGYARASRHQVTLLTMAGQFWKWRMLGAAVELAAQAEALLRTGPPPDLVLATDMLDLATWRGLTSRSVPPSTPAVLYMHENQLTYPLRPGEKRDLSYALVNWRSQLAADAVIFNSRYHRRAWFRALPNLLKHFPDYNHLAQVGAVHHRSRVLPVGLTLPPLHPLTRAPAPPLILWNQRWEYDKRPTASSPCSTGCRKPGWISAWRWRARMCARRRTSFSRRGNGWATASPTGVICRRARIISICCSAPTWWSVRRITSSLASACWRRSPLGRSRCCPSG